MSQIPIYKQLINKYTNSILNQDIAPGKQVDSINKIMQKHKVSRETAKIVLNKLAAEGLIVQVPGKGSFVKFQKETINKWAIILPMYSSNMEQLIDNLMDFAKSEGMKLEYYLHYNNPEEEIRMVSTMIQQGYDSIFIVPNYNEATTSSFYRKLQSENTKIFLVDYTMAGSAFNYVIQSYDLGVKRVTEYFISKNNGNFLFVNDSAWYGVNLVAETMFSTLKHFGENYFNRKVFSVSHHKKVTKEFIDNNSIGGILCYKDTDTIKLYGKLQKLGYSFPDKLSLVNYGNTELLEYFSPGITAINCSYNDIVDKLRIIYKNYDSKNKEQYIISPKIVIRNT